MTPADLRAWQQHMGFTYEAAAEALGVHRATYARMLTRDVVPLQTALACAAVAAGIAPWDADAVRSDEAWGLESLIKPSTP